MKRNCALEFPDTRATLLERLRRLSDQNSWDEFFVIYRPIIYAVARQSHLGHDEAQDVVQELMSRMTKKLPDFDYQPTLGSFRSWIRIATRWCIVQQVRRRLPNFVVSTEAEETLESMHVEANDPEITTFDNLWEKEEALSAVQIATQRAKQRASAEMYQIYDCVINKGWSPRKTANILKTNIPKVYVAKCRFLHHIRTELAKLKRELKAVH